MSKHRIIFSQLTICLIFLVSTAHSSEVKDDNSLTVDRAIRTAINQNPNLASINARFLAISESPIQAGALPEPKLKLNFANLPLDSFAFGKTPMTQLQVGITQALPFPGKLALRSQVAENLASATGEEWQDARLKLVQQVRHQWWQLFYLDRAIEIVSQNQNILQQFVEVAETKYSVGKGLQQDILLAQVEEFQLQDKQLQLLAMKQTAGARLNMLMGHNRNKKIIINENVSEILPKLKTIDHYLLVAKEARPDVNRAKFLTNAAKSRLALAKKNYYPDFQVGAMYGWRKDLTGLASLQLSMTLPWDVSHRQDPARDQRTQEWNQQKFATIALENRIVEEVESTIANYRRAKAQLALFKDGIIPQAKQTVEAMLAGYQVNKVDFLNLLRAQITLFNYDTQYWQALSRANQFLAALDTAIGKNMEQEMLHE